MVSPTDRESHRSAFRAPRSALGRDLRALLPAAAVVDDPAELPGYGRDFWALRGVPGVVVRAGSAEDVAATLRFAAGRGVPVVPRAAGTNVSAGFLPAPEAILLDLRGMDRVVSVDAEERRAVVQPGVLNGDLQTRLAPLGLAFSPDPASRPISTIGGNIAENAGGPQCLKYGVTVHHVDGVSCALPGGDLVRFEATDRGPDLLGLLIGSEGTLAVVTEATVRLRPLPAVTRTLLAIFDRAEQAAEAVSATIAAGIIPAAMEYFDREATLIFEAFAPTGYPTDAEALLLIDVDGSAAEVARDLAALEGLLRDRAREVRAAPDEATRRRLWQGRLQGAQAIVASGRGYFICDTTVPRERIPAMQRTVAQIAARHRLSIIMLGHAGDGNIHPIVLYDRDDPAQAAAMHAADDEVVAAALALGGTITGEHGVGSEKTRQMRQRFAPVELAAQRAVKAAFDPSGILNPGVLLPDATAGEPELPIFAARLREALDTRRAGRDWVDPAQPVAPVTDDGIEIDAENLTVTVGVGTPPAELHRALAARRLHCPLPEGGDDAETIGAVVGGDRDRAAVRDWLLALRATLPEGDEARFGSNAVKDVAGYDMKRLYIGTGAAFGLPREVTLKVRPGAASPPPRPSARP